MQQLKIEQKNNEEKKGILALKEEKKRLEKKHEKISLKAATVAILGEFDSFEVWQELDTQLHAIEIRLKQLEELLK